MNTRGGQSLFHPWPHPHLPPRMRAVNPSPSLASGSPRISPPLKSFPFKNNPKMILLFPHPLNPHPLPTPHPASAIKFQHPTPFTCNKGRISTRIALAHIVTQCSLPPSLPTPLRTLHVR